MPTVVAVLFCAKQKYSEPFQYIISYRVGKHWLCSYAWRINFLQLQFMINKWNLRGKQCIIRNPCCQGIIVLGAGISPPLFQHFHMRTYLCVWKPSSALLCCSFKTITNSRLLGDRTPFDQTALPYLTAMHGCICAYSSATQPSGAVSGRSDSHHTAA